MTYISNINKNKIKSIRNKYIRLIIQKLMGVLLLSVSILVKYMINTGQTLQDQDGTILLVFVPIGLILLFNHNEIVHF